MAGMVHANDVRIAEGLRDMELPADPALAVSAWNRTLNDSVVELAPGRGAVTSPTSTSSTSTGLNEPMGYCFPHYFVLPMYSSASSYRFRPLGPEETLMEIWSLTRYPGGERAGTDRRRPSCGSATIHGGRPILAQDFSNLPKQQRGLHARGFEYMRLSERLEGHISQLPADHRRLPRRPSVREAAPGVAVGQREPAGQADPRHRFLIRRPGRTTEVIFIVVKKSGAPRVRR